MTISIELCVSANLLTWMGVPYVTDGGPILLKLHPGTDLLLILFMASAAVWGKRFFVGMDREIRTFFLAMVGSILCAITFTGLENLIVLLDTFLPAGLMACFLAKAPARDVLLLRHAMQCIFVMNTVLALFEMLAQANSIPLYVDGAEYHAHQEDFRPTALYDHPLTGALMTMMALSLAPSSNGPRAAYCLLMYTGLIAFGGRMAIGISLLSLVQEHAVKIVRMILARDRSAGGRLFLSCGGVLLALVVLATAIPLGLADRLAGHLYWDASAQVRLAQWTILTQLDGWQILFGTPRHELLESLNVLRLTSGVGVIENPWLLMFVSLGMFGFAVFLRGLGALCVWLWRRSDRTGKLLLASVLIVASTSNSLGRKSTVLVCLVASLACCGVQAKASPRVIPVRGLQWREKTA